MNKKYSLKKNKDIANLINRRISVGSKYYAIYYKPNVLDHVRLAISVSKKYGNAVIRNYEKRVTKEILRNFLDINKKYDLLIVIRKDVNQLKYKQKQEQFNYLIKKLYRKIGEQNEK